MKRRGFCKTSLLSAAGCVTQTGAPPLAAERERTFPQLPGLTQYVAEFIVHTSYADIPPDVIALGKKSILDGLGLALAGSAGPLGPVVRKYVESLECGGTASIIGSSAKAPARFAALANGVSIHADDFDDTQLSKAKDRVYGLLTHPTVPVLPPVFALAELGRRSGKELMLAYHVGVEVECKIAEAIAPRHYLDGFHSTGTCGSFGSAAGAAKMRSLTVERTQNALGIIASEAAGVRENFGTMTKPLQAGHAAENGVVAADLAALGWTAAPNILEAERGFFNAYGGSFDPAAISGRLGHPWTFADPGVSIKPFPSGSLTHPAMTELLRLIREHNIAASNVERVDVGGNRDMVSTLLHHRPVTGLQAKFSIEFCLAILLLQRRAGLNQFTDAVVQRPKVQEMIRRVNFYVDPESETAGYNKMMTVLRIHSKDGSAIAGRAAFAKGSPADPMSDEEVADKFRGCAEFAKWPAGKTSAVIESVQSLEKVPDVSALATLLTP